MWNMTIAEVYDQITVADCVLGVVWLIVAGLLVVAFISWKNRNVPGHW